MTPEVSACIEAMAKTGWVTIEGGKVPGEIQEYVNPGFVARWISAADIKINSTGRGTTIDEAVEAMKEQK